MYDDVNSHNELLQVLIIIIFFVNSMYFYEATHLAEEWTSVLLARPN